MQRLHVLTSARILMLGFLSLIVIGTVFLSLPMSTVSGQRPHLVDALFTA